MPERIIAGAASALALVVSMFAIKRTFNEEGEGKGRHSQRIDALSIKVDHHDKKIEEHEKAWLALISGNTIMTDDRHELKCSLSKSEVYSEVNRCRQELIDKIHEMDRKREAAKKELSAQWDKIDRMLQAVDQHLRGAGK